MPGLADDARAAFIDASVWHGTLDASEAILAANRSVANSDIYAAAVVGDHAAVERFLALHPQSAISKGGPRGWDALTYLCFSKYLRLRRERTASFVRAATSLLDAGASANTGFWEGDHQPKPEWESALYGAAGVAHHPELTRLLLERGADPNDQETPYHAPETHDNAALRILVASGKLTAESLATMLLRKADWHDVEGMQILLENGADPNRVTHWGYTALHQALRRDNDIRNIQLLLDHGADATLANRQDGQCARSIAIRRGRGDVLDLLEQRGVPMEMALEIEGVEKLISACARNQGAQVEEIARHEPNLVEELLQQASTLAPEFAGTANTEGLRLLLTLGANVNCRYAGDPYFDIAKDSTPLHVAAWRAWHETVRFLIRNGASIDEQDAKGRTPLALAVRACVDSYWAYRRSPESVEALLAAGASAGDVNYPSGYEAVDKLLAQKR